MTTNTLGGIFQGPYSGGKKTMLGGITHNIVNIFNKDVSSLGGIIKDIAKPIVQTLKLPFKSF